MSIIPENVQEGVPDLELRDDPEWQRRALLKDVGDRVQVAFEQGVEPAKTDIEFLND